MPARNPHRPTIDCTHPNTHHQHGTANAYTHDGCRCEPCTRAVARHHKARQIAMHRGIYKHLTDAAPLATYLAALTDAWACSPESLSTAAGKGTSWARTLIRTPNRRTHPDMIARVQALTIDDLPDNARVTGTGTRRRLRALAHLGYDCQYVANHTGLKESNLANLRSGYIRTTTNQARKAVAVFFEDHWRTPRPVTDQWAQSAASYARQLALNEEWARPADWDDIDWDDAPHTPTPGTTPAPVLFAEEVLHLLGSGYTTDQIIERAGVTDYASLRARLRHQTDPASEKARERLGMLRADEKEHGWTKKAAA